jgi:hypothetical protein
MIITIPEKQYTLIELYDTIAREMGIENGIGRNYDCRYVNVAYNIQDNIYACYREMALKHDPKLSENDIKTGTTIMLAMSGPKVDLDLNANEVEVFEGFIC